MNNAEMTNTYTTQDAKFTADQLRAIYSKNDEILISASAGSGKTTIMVERILRGIENGDVDISRLLVLTFSRNSASDMKTKLLKRLRNRASEVVGDTRSRILDQIDKMSIAKISTIDGFCASVIKENFEYSLISPTFSIADANMMKAYSTQAIDKVLDYFRDDQVFFNIVEAVSKKRTTSDLEKIVKDIHEFLQVLPSKTEWVRDSARCFDTDVDTNPLIANYIYSLRAKTSALHSELTNIQAMYGENNFVNDRLYCLSLLMDVRDYTALYNVLSDPMPLSNWNKKYYEDMDIDADMLTRIKSVGKEVNSIKSELAEYIFAPATMTQMISSCGRYADKLLQVVLLYDEYLTELKKNDDRYDFADIMHECYRMLQIDEVATRVKAQYDYTYIDEYQDTNPLQEAILSIVSDGKRFMVGDVKQSIYGFRHTDPGIFLSKQASEGVQNIPFSKNFRTKSTIIDVVNSLFSEIMRIENSGVDYAGEPMIAGMEYDESREDDVTFRFFTKDTTKSALEKGGVYSVTSSTIKQYGIKPELEYVISTISDLVLDQVYDAHDHVYKPVKYSDIAILSRGRDILDELAVYLGELNIPYDKKTQVTECYSVNILLSMLGIIDNIKQDIPLATVMKSPIYSFTEEELSEIRVENRGVSFYQAVLSSTSPKVRDMLSDISKYRTLAGVLDVYSLATTIVEDKSYIAHIFAMLGEVEAKLCDKFLMMLSSLPLAKELSSFLHDYYTYGIQLPETTSLKENAVTLATIHESKGMEYPIVFLIGCGKTFNYVDASQEVLLDKDMGVVIKTYDIDRRQRSTNILYNVMSEAIKRKNRREEMRLLYVAMTRAQNRLFVTGTLNKKPEFTRDIDLSDSYAEWLIKTLKIDPLLLPTDNDDIGPADFEERPSLEHSDEQLKIAIERNFDYVYPHTTATTTPLKHTATGISRHMDDTDEATTYIVRDEHKYDVDIGNLYHRVMQYISLDTPKEDIDRELDVMLADGILTREQRAKVDISILDRALATPTIAEAIGRGARVHTERSFISKLNGREVGLDVDDDILVQGVIDLLLVEDDGFSIVDYKFSRAPATTLKERYSRQLDVYRLSASRILGIPCKKCIIYSFATGLETEFQI